MSIKVKDINIKYKTYCFFNDIANKENSDPNNIKIQKKLYKDFFIYYIGHVTIK